MRTFPETEDREEVEQLRAEPWMLDLLKLNPHYVFWGPHEDYMWKEGQGWDSRVILARWADMWGLDELNECVNFYFHVERESKDCEACERSGYNEATKALADDFYAFDKPRGAGWATRITQDEVEALVKEGRLMRWTHTSGPHGWQKKDPTYCPTADEVNAVNVAGGIDAHDAINRWILIETRAKRLGIWDRCVVCHGEGAIYTAPSAVAKLTLWMLHPRKGCSRGVEIERIERDELPTIFAWLREAAQRNAKRFAAIPD
jgi:hypothetical protein